jgi:hypothetical protein
MVTGENQYGYCHQAHFLLKIDETGPGIYLKSLSQKHV